MIFLDVDGVLADFVSASVEAAGLPILPREVCTHNYYEPFMDRMTFKRHIADTMYFWEDLKPYPWAHDLVDGLHRLGELHFLTDPTMTPDSPSGKVTWLRKHGFLSGSNYILTKHKELLAKPGRVLVDDYLPNVQAFRREGGEAVLFPQRWNNRGFHFGCVTTLICSEVEGLLNG